MFDDIKLGVSPEQDQAIVWWNNLSNEEINTMAELHNIGLYLFEYSLYFRTTVLLQLYKVYNREG